MTIKQAMTALFFACGAQTVKALVREARLQATFPNDANVEAAARAVLSSSEFSFDSASKCYQFKQYA